ncbi:NB-ARC domain-containing protein, partial [Streptomyces sp. NPDC059082]|uniref:NB-ARC domain-containing protein n=1 Tax=Streptomyces sp. NPDC059082 TaxID=3346720 RepID=UPI0036C4DB1F
MTDQAVAAAGSRQFFGRQRELKALRADIERTGLDTLTGRKAPRARVLLIAGKPGSGRSALAEELAAGLADRYPDGIFRARLTEPGGDPVPTARAAQELLAALGVAEPPGAAEDELTELVRAAFADRRAVLVLDDAVDAEQADPLIPDNPDTLVIGVARGPLTGIPDVRPCTLGGLDPKSAIELLTSFTGSVRVTVDPQAAETLVEECGGLPAAVVLAGGWLSSQPKASVADLAKRLHGLGGDPLTRSFLLAHEALPATAARILRFLALAPLGRADAHTASALAGCSVSAAATTLADFEALGLVAGGEDGQYEVGEHRGP